MNMNVEHAHNTTYALIANITNPASFSYMAEFPGFERLGLNPDNAADQIVADAIIYALQAGEQYQHVGMNSHKAGRIEAMFMYGVVDPKRIDEALWRYRNA